MERLRRILERLDRGWGRVELVTSLAVAGLLVGSLLAWVALKGLSSPTSDAFVAGLVFRASTAAAVMGALGHRLGRGPVVTAAAVAVGVTTAYATRNVGVDYFGNILGWLQDGSLLTWVGGLRGLGTRLTLWLALLGASLATAGGRHVTVDLLTRPFGEGVRRWSARLGGAMAAVVCALAAWGFFDFSAVDAFGASPTAPPSQKVATVASGLARHLGLAARQARIDLAMAGKVLGGRPWSRSLIGREWNELIEGVPGLAGQREADPAAVRSPLLSRPEEASRGLLVKDFNLVVPFGLAMLAARFVLWLLLGAPVEAAHGAAEEGG